MSASHSENEDIEDQDEEFQDATDDTTDIPITNGMPLDKAVKEASDAIYYFFNNQFTEAKNLMKPYAQTSFYHAAGASVFDFIEAVLTFEPQHIANATKALKQALSVCHRFRKKRTISESLGKIVTKSVYEHYTEEEAHAEMCYAECLLLRAILTFMEDETLSSFIKASFKIKSCYNSYKDCYQVLQKNNWNDSPNRVHFESGVQMGVGTFNLMISMLPARIIKLLEFIGFSGNKEYGLKQLYKGYNSNGIRQILCVMTLLGYNLIVLYVLSYREGDTAICDEILAKKLETHPDGVWFLFYKGRLEFMKGHLTEAINWYKKSWHSQNLWPQFHHICYWELMWVHCVKAEWKDALTYCQQLLEGSRWSRTMYSYQKAAIMLMMRSQLSAADRIIVDNLMRDVPQYKQRIAGKSLPMEKFAIRKSERYFGQQQFLVLPTIELMYIWNLFKTMKQFEVASAVHKTIEQALSDLNDNISTIYTNDNRALVLLLQGACLRRMNSPLQALDCLETAIGLQKDIVEDHYIVPYAIVELALIEWERGNQKKAILALEDVKKNYSGYSLESRLHFRIHTALTDFKAEIKK